MPVNNIKKKEKKYTCSKLNCAINSVRNESISIRSAAKQWNIPRTTLRSHVRSKNPIQSVGRPLALNQNTEKSLVAVLALAAEWGFPIEVNDVRYLVQDYLNSNQILLNRFKDNLPGPRWTTNFIKRYSEELTARKPQYVKRSRAKVSESIISSYFDNLSVNLEGIPPSQIINFDETACTDDPARNKVICRRTLKHADKVIDSSKSSTSVMFACAANGVLLPPYVVYKSRNLYESWCQGGPNGTRYNCSQSGWFESSTFEDWFESIIVPFCNSIRVDNRPFVVIGDNVCTHLSLKVAELANANNIKFIFLPANSTHLTQPLDVSVFKPFKSAWKSQLLNWKKSKTGNLSKSAFPLLLKRAIDSMSANSEKNIQSGFRATGIYPLDRNQVLWRLPKEVSRTSLLSNTQFDDILLNFLKKERYGNEPNHEPPRKKIMISPGKSVSVVDIERLKHKKNIVSRKIKSFDPSLLLQTKLEEPDSVLTSEVKEEVEDKKNLIKPKRGRPRKNQ